MEERHARYGTTLAHRFLDDANEKNDDFRLMRAYARNHRLDLSNAEIDDLLTLRECGAGVGNGSSIIPGRMASLSGNMDRPPNLIYN